MTPALAQPGPNVNPQFVGQQSGLGLQLTNCNHCNSGGCTLDGTWYANGDPRRPCSISQRLGALTFINELGNTAAGNFDGPSHLAAMWQGMPIGATLGADGS